MDGDLVYEGNSTANKRTSADEESTLVLAVNTTSASPAVVDSTTAPPAAVKSKKELTTDQRKIETEKRGMRRKRTKTKAEEM